MLSLAACIISTMIYYGWYSSGITLDWPVILVICIVMATSIITVLPFESAIWIVPFDGLFAFWLAQSLLTPNSCIWLSWKRPPFLVPWHPGR